MLTAPTQGAISTSACVAGPRRSGHPLASQKIVLGSTGAHARGPGRHPRPHVTCAAVLPCQVCSARKPAGPKPLKQSFLTANLWTARLSCRHLSMPRPSGSHEHASAPSVAALLPCKAPCKARPSGVSVRQWIVKTRGLEAADASKAAQQAKYLCKRRKAS